MTDRRRHHDMGGLEAGPIQNSEHAHEPWEKRVDAIKALLSDDRRKLVTTDELRRSIENLGADAYERYNYYERWISSVTNILIEKGILDIDELGRRMEDVRAQWEAAK